MHWLRNNIRHGSLLALMALAINLALTFGHVHAFGKVCHDGAGAVVASVGVHHGKQPAGHSDDGQADYLCPICMAASTIASAVAPTPPVLPAEFAVALIDRPIDRVLPVRQSGRTAFQSRGPPIS
jgi:hypothetical protein